MKAIFKTFIFGCIVLMTASSLSAQDQIILKDGKKIDCIIKELSDSKVKYVEIEDANQIIFSLNRGQVREIKFSYGKVIEEEPDAINEAYFVDDHVSNLKIDFLSISRNAAILTYERSINPFSSWEVSAKYIGIGFNDSNAGYDEKGFGLDLAYRIKLKSLTNKDGYRPNHLLHGGYLRTAIGVASSTKKIFVWNQEDGSLDRTLVHLGLDIGKQWIIQNRISLDLYAGLHYYGGSENTTVTGTDVYYDRDFDHGDLRGNDNVAGALGFRVGYLFQKKGGNNKKVSRR